ncbi:biopolymer transport protein ExbB/TolQ [Azospirillum lipoferum]|nr:MULTISPECIES: MotA/TolQ/ExbB proton channel family protein [Azospirillum]MCP1613539.1 biopolymer transport protein ExbB/TolQ [Azospirillum lipoferum]MDW5532305.1 MotA/TolQ/ExbB proton channel family protein [Azospirillum sp. NL1]
MSVLDRLRRAFGRIAWTVLDVALFGSLAILWAAISFRSVERWFGLPWSIHMEGPWFNLASLLLLGIATRQSLSALGSLNRQHESFARTLRAFPEDVWELERDARQPAAAPSVGGRSASASNPVFLRAVETIAARESLMAQDATTKTLWMRVHELVGILRSTGDYGYVTVQIEKFMQRLKDHAEHQMVWPRTIFWVIPSVGFLGTVSGISSGIASFTERSGFTLLSPTTRQLGIAFDATFVALSATILVTLGNGLVEHKAGRLFALLENWLLHEVVARSVLKNDPGAPEQG